MRSGHDASPTGAAPGELDVVVLAALRRVAMAVPMLTHASPPHEIEAARRLGA